MSDVHERRLLVALLIAAVALTAVLAKPFWEALFMAAVVAAALQPPMGWLTARLRGRRALAAGILTLAVLLAAVLPFAALGAIVVGQVVDGIHWLRQTLQSAGVSGMIDMLPAPLQHAARELLARFPEPRQLLESVGAQSGQAAVVVGSLIAATGTAAFKTALGLIALFFFLEDGARLLDWLDAAVPLRPGQFRALMQDFRQTSVSVLVATVGTALIQSAAALLGYLLARAPNPVFLMLLTFVSALVPAAGATVVVVAVGLLLLAAGHTFTGVFLVVWGLVVVSLTDNLARPFLLKGGMALHGGLVFFALLGGIAVFGGIGLLLGPLVLTFLVSVMKLYRREFTPPAEPADAGR